MCDPATPPAPSYFDLEETVAALRALLAEEDGGGADACPVCGRSLAQHRHRGPCSCRDCCNQPLPFARLAPAPPAPPDELRKAAERHYSTLLSGLAYVVRGSWWPEHDELTNGVREHVAKMRDAADELRALAARGGE